jgi:hypothetical protein
MNPGHKTLESPMNTGGWLTPCQAFAEARGLVTLIKDSAASSPVKVYILRGNASVLEGSGGASS